MVYAREIKCALRRAVTDEEGAEWKEKQGAAWKKEEDSAEVLLASQ